MQRRFTTLSTSLIVLGMSALAAAQPTTRPAMPTTPSATPTTRPTTLPTALPTSGLSYRLLYETPTVEELTLQHPARIVHRGAVPDYVEVIVLTLRPAAGGEPDDRVKQIARQAGDAATAEYAGVVERRPRARLVVAKSADDRDKLVGDAYDSRTIVRGDDGQPDAEVYVRKGFPKAVDWGVARVTIHLRPDPARPPQIDELGRMRLHLAPRVTVEPVRVSATAQRGLVQLVLRRLAEEAEAEAAELAKQLDACEVQPADKQRLLDGEREVAVPVSFTWHGEPQQLQVRVAATRGGRIVLDVPGSPPPALTRPN